MATTRPKSLSSEQLLHKIGLHDGQIDPSLVFADDDDDGNLTGDLCPLLHERYRQMIEIRHDLQPGMLVTWKPGLQNKRWPQVGAPAVVIERLEAPLYDCDESGSAYFREPLDLVLGLFIDEGRHRGDFIVFHYDSRRFRPWTKQED